MFGTRYSNMQSFNVGNKIYISSTINSARTKYTIVSEWFGTKEEVNNKARKKYKHTKSLTTV